jgi:hypothetical protein
MVPQRFVTEYPERCLALLDAIEPLARERDLVATFALLTASSVLVIPYERLGRLHPMSRERGSRLHRELRSLEKVRWYEAPFWANHRPDGWQFSRIVTDPNQVSEWVNAYGIPSASDEANEISKRMASDVLRVLRNALAHGNVVYLNEHGQEVAGTAVRHLGFLSRYEETPEQRANAETYRLVVATDEAFLNFVRLWATWLAYFPPEYDLTEAA